MFENFKRRVIDQYAAQVSTTLNASKRFTREEIEQQRPVAGEVDDELKQALTLQEPTGGPSGIVIDLEANVEEESRKRARTDEPSSSSTTFLPPTPKLAAPKVRSAPQPAAPLTSTSSSVPHAEGVASRPLPSPESPAVPNIVTESTEVHYERPACKDLPEHVIKTYAGGTRLLMVTTRGGSEAELPLVPAKGMEYHRYLAQLTATFLPSKQILRKLSRILRGH